MKKTLYLLSATIFWFLWIVSADSISIYYETVEYTVKFPTVQWYCSTDQQLFATEQYVPYIKDEQVLRMFQIKLDAINTAMINYNNMNKSCYPDPSQVWRYKNPRTICPDTASPLNNICSLEKDAIEYITNAYNNAIEETKRNNETFWSLLQQADNYANNNEYSKAIEYYERALNMKNRVTVTNDVVSQIENAISSLKLKQQAANELKKAEELKAEQQKMVDKMNEANNYTKINDYTKALSIVDEVLRNEWKIEWGNNYEEVKKIRENIQKLADAEKTWNEAQAEKAEEEKNAEIQKAKEALWSKAVIFEWLVPLFKQKDTTTQTKVKTLLKTFESSKDSYTRNIGIYFWYLIQ